MLSRRGEGDREARSGYGNGVCGGHTSGFGVYPHMLVGNNLFSVGGYDLKSPHHLGMGLSPDSYYARVNQIVRSTTIAVLCEITLWENTMPKLEIKKSDTGFNGKGTQPLESQPATSLEDFVDHGLQIVVLTQGFVYLGHARTNATWCLVTDCINIRQWGTTEGLGELALKGPLQPTVLDKVGALAAPIGSLVSLIQPQTDNWPVKMPDWQSAQL